MNNTVVEKLVEIKVLPEQAVSVLTPAGFSVKPPGEEISVKFFDPDQVFELERLKMEYQLRMIEAEKEKIHMQMQREEIQAEIRLTDITADKDRSHVEIEAKREQSQESRQSKFKPEKATFLLPVFSEEDIDRYFCTFERLAAKHECPEDQWVTILVPKLIGKAHRVFTSLDQPGDYHVVKESILKAYAITPDGYRQQFRNLRKSFSQTFSEFAYELKRLFQEMAQSHRNRDYIAIN